MSSISILGGATSNPPNVMSASGPILPGYPGPGVITTTMWQNLSISLGSMLIQGWVKNLNNTTGYCWCSGNGGAHGGGLFGFSSNGPGLGGACTGNIMGGHDLGAGPVADVPYSFGSQAGCDDVAYGEWAFYQVYYDAQNALIVLTINGIVCGRAAMPFRFSSALNDSMYFFAHGHDEFTGSMSWVQMWEKNLFPGDPNTVSLYCQAYRVPMQPELFRVCSDGQKHAPDLSHDFASGQELVPDMAPPAAPVPTYNPVDTWPLRSECQSLGIYYYCIQAAQNKTPASEPTYWTAVANEQGLPNNRGFASIHPGQLQYMGTGLGPIPQRIYDSTYPPSNASPRTIPNAYVKLAYAAPSDRSYLAFDSFGRAQSNWATNSDIDSPPSLGLTDGGTLGPLAWSHNANGPSAEFYGAGIRNGCAIYLGISDASATKQSSQVIDIGTPNHGIQWRKPTGALAGTSALNPNGGGGCFRYTDDSNQLVAFLNQNHIQIKKVVAGTVTSIGSNFDLTANWDSVRVTIDGAHLITIYRGTTAGGFPGVTTWTSEGSFTDASITTGNKVGINAGDSGSYARYENFGAFSV